MPSYKYGNLIQNLCCIHPVHVWEALDEETKLTDIRALLLRGTVSLCQCMEASMDIDMIVYEKECRSSSRVIVTTPELHWMV
jgi:hypothetical protein